MDVSWKQAINIADVDLVRERIINDGFCVIKDVVPRTELEMLAANVKSHFRGARNSRRNGVIPHGRHRFIGNTMLVPGALSVYTNTNLIELADSYCETDAHLSNHRIYRNLSSFTSKMVWHKDNKSDAVDIHGRLVSKMRPEDKGLILIMYLTPVSVGGLQFIPGSHLNHNDRETFSVSELKGQDVFTLNKCDLGTGILYDYRIIHRAQPVRRFGHFRDSLFAQMSPKWMPIGEPIAVHASEISGLDEKAQRFISAAAQEDGRREQHAPHYPVDNGQPGSVKRRMITLVSR